MRFTFTELTTKDTRLIKTYPMATMEEALMAFLEENDFEVEGKFTLSPLVVKDKRGDIRHFWLNQEQ